MWASLVGDKNWYNEGAHGFNNYQRMCRCAINVKVLEIYIFYLNKRLGSCNLLSLLLAAGRAAA